MTAKNHGGVFEAERREDGAVILTFRPPNVDELLKSEAMSHLIASQRELLLAARSMLDSVIGTMDRTESDRRRTRIKVD